MAEPLALISVTTFMKSDGLRVLLESLLEHGYDKIAEVHIADDNAGARYLLDFNTNPNHPYFLSKEYLEDPHASCLIEKESAVDVWEDMKDRFANGLFISYGKGRGGISINKNRGVYYFLNRSKAPYLLLLDDDIRFVRSGMIEEWISVLEENTKLDSPTGAYSLDHLTGYWSDIHIDADKWEDKFEAGKSWSVTKAGWFDQFPVEALSPKVEWRKGCMGVANFATRKAVNAVQYYNILPGKYGYEHSLWSSRIMLKTNKRSPQLFPIYDWSENYFIGQAVPNNYGETVEEAQKSDPEYQRLMNSFTFGLNLVNKEHGLNEKEEVILNA